MSHLDHLERVLGDFRGKRILDLGSGRGDFLIACAEKGCEAEGIELNAEKVAASLERAREKDLAVKAVQGAGERLPFPDTSFDFVNLSEVIEHVRDPEQVLRETVRVLKPGGQAYVSVHNRFGAYDTHFHAWFLGWMPRAFADGYLRLLGKHKAYEQAPDLQKIGEMHYYTYGAFARLATQAGFSIRDLRIMKLCRRPWGAFLLLPYRLLRPWTLPVFHVLLTKRS